MKYVDAKVVFSEIPDEITLAINISGCKIHCPDCHSKYLWEDIGEELNEDSLFRLINENSGISCICLMGGDQDTAYLLTLFQWLKTKFPMLKTAWYSGVDEPDIAIFKYLDYLKVGPYKKEFGPLDNPTTNQKLYKVLYLDTPSAILRDITYKFWKRDSSEK